MKPTRKVVVVGGGSAGWITANILAAASRGGPDGSPQVVLIESADIPTIGVGEGTWPSMRGTLQRIGLAESEFLAACDASFKQGTRFVGWRDGTTGAYTHPFSWPLEYARLNPALRWLSCRAQPFAESVTPQADVIARGLAPKQASAPEYAFTVNYGYHLNAAKFAGLLRRQAVERLGVTRIEGTVAQVEAHPDGDIAALVLNTGRRIEGDLFVDCTGHRALLFAGHFKRPLVSVADVLFNDRAVVVQVPYEAPAADAIASATWSTAQTAGWIWDIGLQTRRGLGYVYSSAHEDDDAAQETLRRYVERTSPATDAGALAYRTLKFSPGYRAEFWVRNCVAVGLSAGFIEPLEASALALVEQAADLIARQLPQDRQIMDVVAKRFNAKMRYHWERIVEFLKLHYAVSQREDSVYWRDNREAGTWPVSLRDKLALWQQQPPWHDDAPLVDELFPSASYQYVLYGLGFEPRYAASTPQSAGKDAPDPAAVFARTRDQARQLTSLLPTNRELVAAMAQRGG